jgi:acyl-CoA oxidase
LTDYIQVQYRLFPLIAQAVGIKNAGDALFSLFLNMRESLNQENIDVSVIAEVHGLSTALKVYATNCAADGVELARRACGGNGANILLFIVLMVNM